MKLKRGDYIRQLDTNNIYKVKYIDWEDDSILATIWRCELIITNNNNRIGSFLYFTKSGLRKCKKLTKDEYMVEIL